MRAAAELLARRQTAAAGSTIPGHQVCDTVIELLSGHSDDGFSILAAISSHALDRAAPALKE